jgi:hypothetical protein
MNQSQVEEVIHQYLTQALNGASLENPKLDFKSKWYNLTSEEDKQEFIADTSAIANTFGLDGYIIIGYDEKTKTFTPSPFSECGLRDSSDIMNLVSKSVDPIYTLHVYTVEYEGNQLSVLHMPPSIAKPHMIRCFKKGGREEQHRLFVRKGTGKQIANRYDIELMYYDRKNIVPEYELIGSFHAKSVLINKVKQDSFGFEYHIKLPLILENVGRRPASIVKMWFGLTSNTNPTHPSIVEIYNQWLYSPTYY